jgi:hypothetical protein
LHLIIINYIYTIGRTPLDEGSVLAEAFTCTTHEIYKRQILMPPAGFEPKLPACERRQTYALVGGATGIDIESKGGY